MTGRAVLIGNGPSQAGAASRLRGADAVVRINGARGFGAEHGTRTTHLFLVNCGGAMAERLADPGFTDVPVIAAAEHVILPIAPETDDLREPPVPPADRLAPDARNYAVEASARLAAIGKPVSVMPTRLFVRAVRAAGHEAFTPQTPPPSTGLLALVWLMDACPGTHVDCFGFGFEGWRGHAWDGERAFFEAQAAAGRATLHPVARAG